MERRGFTGTIVRRLSVASGLRALPDNLIAFGEEDETSDDVREQENSSWEMHMTGTNPTAADSAEMLAESDAR
jgi:hypothetical protein